MEDAEADEYVELPGILASWKDTNQDEISKLIGMYLFMGLSRKPELHSYWNKTGIGFSCFSDCI
jgi:hypothetical protein